VYHQQNPASLAILGLEPNAKPKTTRPKPSLSTYGYTPATFVLVPIIIIIALRPRGG